MMNVSVICVGKLKESYLREGCSEYIKRLGAFAKVSVIEVAEERCGDSPSASSVAFIIGGSFGLSPQVKQLGKIKLSFGKMTLPHQLARLVLLEQVYRAFSINNNSKYHK